MKTHAGIWMPSLAPLAMVCVLCVWMGLAPGVDAGVGGSPHDFSGLPGVAPSGTCSACHIPHGAWSSSLWKRDLDLYVTKLDANGGTSGSKVNYVHSPTILCYDCHDSHATGYIDDVPAKTSFDSSYPPQDIAFGGDNPGGVAGYYENNPPYPPGGPFSTSLGANKDLDPDNSVQLQKTGGHYFKTDPGHITGGEIFGKGDKLPCRDCHDPHSSLQAFIRTNIPWSGAIPGLGSSYSSVKASTKMTNNLGRTRDDAESRKICVQCHSYSNSGTPLKFSQISSAYTNSTDNVPKPPGTVIDHDSGAGAACVSCHKHNSVAVNCNSCHSYPGLDNSASLRQMSQVHWKHVGKPGTNGTLASRGYDCEVCHYGYKSSHNGNNISPGQTWGSYDATKVDIRFDNNWNPGSVTYNGSNAGTATAAGNGGTGTCAGLYCHGNNATMNAGWNGSASTPKWDNVGGAPCGGCHDTGISDTTAATRMSTGNHPVHLDNASRPYGPETWRFSAGGNCSEGTAGFSCHAAYGLSPGSTHVNGKKDFSDGTDTLALTTVCNSCHSESIVQFADNGSNLSNSGKELAKANWAYNTYRLPCLTCHNNSGKSAGATANTLMGGTGAWAPGIEKYWRSAGHGFSLVSCPTTSGNIDNCSTSDTTTQNVYQKLPVPCSYCHAVASRHFGNTNSTGTSLWRLVSWSNDNVFGGLDKFCALQCHGGSEAGSSWDCFKPGLPMDHFWIDGNGAVCRGRDDVGAPLNKEGSDTHPSLQDAAISGKTKNPNVPTTNYMPLETDIRSGGGALFLCVTCHDPHGTGYDAAGPGNWLRSFAGSNPTALDNLHMLRYEQRSVPGYPGREVLCKKCHI